MTEEQRRQAAAQRCADLARASGSISPIADGYLVEPVDPSDKAFLNAVLELDELARIVADYSPNGHHRVAAHKHILPEPKPSPVERLAKAWGADPCSVSGWLEHLGLKLVEVDPSDDQ